MIIQGRNISHGDINLIAQLLNNNPSWHRTRLSKELCKIWDWRNLKGNYKDMACRTLLLKLEKAAYILLPPRRVSSGGNSSKRKIMHVSHNTSPINTDLQHLIPLSVETVKNAKTKALFNNFFSRYHYLGYSGTVGQNMRYLIFDRNANPLACLMFGSAAWKVKPRDYFIGWSTEARKRNLHFITNNMRFLILPWVRVPHLASHILARMARRISSDWIARYGHPVHLLETFVEQERFHGTCYKAANWIHVGQTKGRTRNDCDNSIRAPIKNVYLYPLSKNFRNLLRHESR